MLPIDPRSMQRMHKMMKQLGITVEDLPEVESVIIRTKDKEIIFDSPKVTITRFSGEEIYQIMGEARIVERAGEEAGIEITDEDIKLVAEQAGVSEEEARRALEETGGDIAEAILRLRGE